MNSFVRSQARIYEIRVVGPDSTTWDVEGCHALRDPSEAAALAHELSGVLGRVPTVNDRPQFLDIWVFLLAEQGVAPHLCSVEVIEAAQASEGATNGYRRVLIVEPDLSRVSV